MKIEIVTKFNIGDEVVAYVNKQGFKKFRVENIRVQTYSIDYTGENIEYLCSTVTDSNLKCQQTFTESELFTADELRDCVNKFLTFPTTSAEAKHDLDMYVGIKDYIRNQPAVNMSDNVRWIDFINWLESKFPEMEQYVKMNTRTRF